MQIEHERRFQLTSEAYLALLTLLDWSSPSVVTDVMMGRSGQLSMATDGWVIRLRKTDGRGAMQFKGRLKRDNEHLEVGVGIDSMENAAKLLSFIGLRLGLVITRTRRCAEVNGAQLALDDVSCLGQFLEVEVSDDQDYDVFTFLSRYVDLATECETYGDLILDKQRTDAKWAERYREESKQLLIGLRLQHLESDRAWWRDHA
ncbi:MAG: CYTH domain-containing protein [Gammaproteobacteria bacterium]